MTTPKLKHLLSILCSHLSEKKVPHAIIGAMALSLYGMPRFTADIDLLSDEVHRKVVLELMKNLDYECFQDAGNFAQFDSELGVYGKVDFRKCFARLRRKKSVSLHAHCWLIR